MKNTILIKNTDAIQLLESKRDEINLISPSFCTAKWLQTTLVLQTGYNHSCHHPSPHKIPEEEVKANPAALHNSKFKKEQRAKMLKGIRPDECGYCWNIEDLGKGYFSDRHTKTADYWAWDRFNEIAESDPNDDVYPAYLEVSFSNACNFACAYCSPDISSKWMKDIKKNGPYPVEFGSHDLSHLEKREQFPYEHDEYNPYVEAFEKWFPEAYPHLKVFRITGGEPTMSKDMWKTLDYIIANPRKDLEVSINTNLGVPIELVDKLIKYAKIIDESCKECQIYTSNESHGKQAEYARDGMDYNYWFNNVEKILNKTNCRVVVMTTINVLSLPSFNRFIQDIMELRISYNEDGFVNRIPLSINYLRFPPHLQVTLLTDKLREKYATEIENYAESWLEENARNNRNQWYAKLYLEEYNQIKRFCDYMRKEQSSGEKYRRNFIQFINAYDIRRKKNFAETFPEYIEFYNNCRSEHQSYIMVNQID